MACSSADDQEPLLAKQSYSNHTHSTDGRHAVFRLSKLARYCLLLEFLLELSNNISTVPLIALFERAICEAYKRDQDPVISYGPSSTDGVSCKIPPIQSELARLRGWKGFFETLAGKSYEHRRSFWG